MSLRFFEPSMETRARIAAIRGAIARGNTAMRAIVVGAGKSGLSSTALLKAKGFDVSVVDDKPFADLKAEVKEKLAGLRYEAISKESLAGADLVILSPGVPRTRPELEESIARGVLVGEIELASWFVRVPLVGITGTNGKSTTTAMVGHLIAAAGLRVFTGGNLGRPLADLAASGEQVDAAVVELSSYQLESIVEAQFLVACWLNLTPDHTDRYPSHLAYGAAKRRLLEARSLKGVAVLNALDPECRAAGGELSGAVRWFASDRAEEATAAGTSLVEPDRAIRVNEDGGAPELYRLDNPKLPGIHNRANMCAAIECARWAGASPEGVQAGLLSFGGLPHRIELVGTACGARWYNDSKATNVDSAVTALRALDQPKILIAGGKDKGAPWTPLAELAKGSVRAVLAIGMATPIVLETFKGVVPVVEDAGTLDRAVARAAELARPGDAVLLAPACASFDQFDNYEHRGDTFRRLVQELAAREAR